MQGFIEQGQTVASSFNTPTIFTIANDLTKMQVEADVDEADIGQVKVGQPVTFTVDAFPDDVFTGTVKQIRLEPTETQNVITYTVIIDAPNADMKLMPGMTASVSIVVEKESGVAIPMESLFFTLDQMEMEKLSKVGFSFKKLYNTKEEETNSLKDITKKTIWVGDGKQFEQRSVTPGINDGATSLIKEGLKEGEHVVVGTRELSGKPDGKSGSNPFMPGPPQRTKR